jgi:DMSO/TMAO reductase YedYZ molybdopterin-dependent catalytic subunit
MNRIKYYYIFAIVISLTFILFFLVSCINSGTSTGSGTTAAEGASITTGTTLPINEGTNYLDLYQGLHITGTPIDVDITTYRLVINGAVNKEISLTFDDVKKMNSVREEIEVVCPGFFTDVGFWTGVRVIDLLNLAGLQSGVTGVNFVSIDGSYSQILPLDLLKNDGFLIAYQFNDKEFSKYHGYPLRLVAKGQAGSNWVKWLGKMSVIIQN